MRTLYQCLLDADWIKLRVIARRWNIDLTASRKRDGAAQLAEAMTSPSAVVSSWEALSDDQRQALESLLAAGGRMPWRVFARRWGEIRPMGPGRMEREQPWQAPVSPAEGLWYAGFIYRAFEFGPDGALEIVFIPAELKAHLPAPPISQPAIVLAPAPPPSDVRASGDALCEDACTLLAYLQNERVQPGPEGEWPARHEALLAHRLMDPSPDRMAFLRHMVCALGWLRQSDSRLRPDPGPATAWLQSPPSRQQAALAEAWRNDPDWNDLFHVPTLRPEDTGAWHNDPALARNALLRHLEACTPETWYRLDDLVQAIKEVDPDFQRPGGDYATWYIRDAATGAYLAGFECWDQVEGALIRYLITGPLAWLGLVDLDAGLPPRFFRINRRGAAFLGLIPSPADATPPPLTLRADWTVLAPLGRRYERFQLSRVADWVASPAADEGGGRSFFIYRFTPASLTRARRQGIPIPRVLEFLEQATGAAVPQPIAAALTRWGSQGTEVRLERAILLRTTNEALLTQLISSPATRGLIHERLGPTAALVRERDWPRVAAALRKMGLLAEIVGLEAAP